jgi:hypothetical protein
MATQNQSRAEAEALLEAFLSASESGQVALRETLEWFGDELGVHVRGASDDLVLEFGTRLVMLAREAVRRAAPDEQSVESVYEIVIIAARRAVQDLFGGAELAS